MARHSLPHQLHQLGRHAADVLVTVNRPPGAVPDPALTRFLDELTAELPQLRVAEVDHGPQAVEWVSRTFFGGRRFPMVDHKGTPVHAYLEPYRAIDQPFVLHLDSDVLLGGSGERWLHEAVAVLRSEDRYLAAGPLAGPPAPDGSYLAGGEPVDTVSGPGRSVPSFTGRLHLVERDRFLGVAPLPLRRPRTRWERVRARLLGLPPVQNLEWMVEHQVLAAGQRRIDLGGSGGLWCLHPLHKTPAYLAALPELIRRVEAGDVPPAQRGRYDLHDSFLALDDLPGRGARASHLVRSLHPFGARPGSWS